MITDFKLFGIEHIISIIIPVIIGILFIVAANKYPKKRGLVSILFAVTIILTRSVRYFFDIQLGEFSIFDILSLHVCNIDMILLAICLTWPNRKIFTFTYLIGIPTALAVALMPGHTHPDPGMARAIFFIMSHTMLVMGAVYLLAVYKFTITKKDIIFYYLFAFFGIIAIYIFNSITGANFMYLMEGPKNTVLGNMYTFFGPFLYICMIYIILVSLLTALYYIHKTVMKSSYHSSDTKTLP